MGTVGGRPSSVQPPPPLGLCLKGGGVFPPPPKLCLQLDPKARPQPQYHPPAFPTASDCPRNRFYSAPQPLRNRSELAPRAPSPSSKPPPPVLGHMGGWVGYPGFAFLSGQHGPPPLWVRAGGPLRSRRRGKGTEQFHLGRAVTRRRWYCGACTPQAPVPARRVLANDGDHFEKRMLESTFCPRPRRPPGGFVTVRTRPFPTAGDSDGGIRS